MITLLVGPPGGGKTFYAVDKKMKISNNELPEFKNIEYVYSNIAGFKFDLFKECSVSFNRFIFDEFYNHLKILFAMFKSNENKENLDDILQDYCKKHNLLNAYFVIDEAHNFFDNQDKIKVWWLTYHRHLNHEILLITQNKSLINTIYRNIPEIFIKSLPRSKAISPNQLRYFHYTEYRMTQKFMTSDLNINNSYFNLYKSGNKSNQKLVGKKFIIFFIIFLIFMFLLFGFFFYKLNSDITPVTDDKSISQTNFNKNQNDTITVTPLQQTKTFKNLDLTNKKYMQLICSKKYNYCLYQSQRINFQMYLKFKNLYEFDEFSLTKIDNDFFIVDVFVSEYFYSLFDKKDGTNEKNSNNNITENLSIFK